MTDQTQLLREALQQAVSQMDMAGDCIEAGRLDEALLHVRSLRASKLAALSAPAASPIEAQAQLREWVNPKGEIQRTYISEGPITGRTYTLQPSAEIAALQFRQPATPVINLAAVPDIWPACIGDAMLKDGEYNLFNMRSTEITPPVQPTESAIRALSSAKRALMNWCNLHPDEKGALDTIALEAIDKALTAAQAEGGRK